MLIDFIRRPVLRLKLRSIVILRRNLELNPDRAMCGRSSATRLLLLTVLHDLAKTEAT